MNVSQQAAARGGKFWARLCALPTFSFLLNGTGGVARVKDPAGNWVERSEVQQIVDDAESRITELDTEKTRPYQVGDLTSARVFKAAGLDNMSDMQAVLDAVEAALKPAPPQERATQLAGGAVARIRAVDEYGPCLDWFEHWVNFPAGTLLYGHPAHTANALEAVGQAIRDYQHALESRQHGGVAASKALDTIQAALAAAPQAPAAAVAHPHHCTARTADGACEECEMHSQAMAEWKAETSLDKPRVAWNCSCAPGHDGTCAVTPAAPAVDARELLEALQGIKALGWLKEHSCLNAAGIKAVRKARAALAAHGNGSAQP